MATVLEKEAIREPPRSPLTYEQFLEWADEDTYAEWVDGEVELMSPASRRHQKLALYLGRLLGEFEERGAGEVLGTRQSGEAGFRLATPDMLAALLPVATDDARLLIDRDGGLEGSRGQAARTALYLFERDAGVALLRSG